MKLKKLTDRVWYYPMEERRDRPVLGYIRGDRWSLAVDAGHSDAHVADFNNAIEKEGLPLPKLTVITHWHWDHTFGLHAIAGLSLANAITNKYLCDYRAKIDAEGPEVFLNQYESIRAEYAGSRLVKVVPADMEFSGEMRLDAGNCPIRVFQAEAPHTDDSTLIEIPEEGVLFLGDAVCGVFPTWKKDPGLCKKLADTIKNTNVKYCVSGHWEPLSKDETLTDLVW